MMEALVTTAIVLAVALVIVVMLAVAYVGACVGYIIGRAKAAEEYEEERERTEDGPERIGEHNGIPVYRCTAEHPAILGDGQPAAPGIWVHADMVELIPGALRCCRHCGYAFRMDAGERAV